MYTSPLEQFEVYSLIKIVVSYNFALTNYGLYLVLVLLIILSLNYISSNIIVPTRYIIGVEMAFTTVNVIVKEQISKEVYTPFIYSIFILILFANLFSNVPYNYSIASSAVFSLGLSITLFLGNTILAIHKHGFKFLTFFLPAGTPLGLVPLLYIIEIVSYVSRAVSLGTRLFANLVSGHALLSILSTILYKIIASKVGLVMSVLPLTLFTGIIGLEIIVSFIQAYVWCTLLSSYIKDAEYLHRPAY